MKRAKAVRFAIVGTLVFFVGCEFKIPVRPLHDGVQSARFMPNGSDILVTYQQGSNRHIWMVAADESSKVQLTKGQRVDTDPVFSPDGSTIVFSSVTTDERPHLFVMNADGSDLKQITSGAVWDRNPRFSLFGDRLVFQSSTDGNQHNIFTIRTNGTEREQLTTSHSNDVDPEYTRDSSRVVFARATRFGRNAAFDPAAWHDWDLYVAATGDRQVTRLTRGQYYDYNSKTMSHDAKEIIFDVDEAVGTDIWKVSLDNPGEVVEVLIPDWLKNTDHNISVQVDDVQYSAFATSLLFVMSLATSMSKDFVPNELYLMDLDPTWVYPQLTLLGSHIEHPRYSPDNTQITFRVVPKPREEKQIDELWVINSDGTGARRIFIGIENTENIFEGLQEFKS